MCKKSLKLLLIFITIGSGSVAALQVEPVYSPTELTASNNKEGWEYSVVIDTDTNRIEDFVFRIDSLDAQIPWDEIKSIDTPDIGAIEVFKESDGYFVHLRGKGEAVTYWYRIKIPFGRKKYCDIREGSTVLSYELKSYLLIIISEDGTTFESKISSAVDDCWDEGGLIAGPGRHT